MIALKNAATLAVAYSLYRVVGDRAVYVGPLASDIVNDSLIIKSIAPKRNGTNLGNRRSELNLVTSTTVKDTIGNDVVRDRKLALVSSVPVGTSEADVLEDITRFIELLKQPNIVNSILLTGKIEL